MGLIASRRWLGRLGAALALGGCSALVQDPPPPVVADALRITSADALPTARKIIFTTPRSWAIAKRGALEGMARCGNIRGSGSTQILYQLLLCLPLSGMVGAVAGYAADPAPTEPDVGDLVRYLGAGQPQQQLHRYARQAGHEFGFDILSALAALEASAPEYAELEIWLRAVQIQVFSRKLGPRLRLALDIRVRVLEPRSGAEVQVFELDWESEERSYFHWVSDDFAAVDAFLEAAATRLVLRLGQG